jgi:hypothetical protein
MVVPKGPAAAFSGSTWIHWWSPVASANRSIRFWSISSQSLYPNCSPTAAFSSSADVKILGSAMSLASRVAMSMSKQLLSMVGRGFPVNGPEA